MAIREHKRSYEVYLIHHAHSQNSQDQRRYSKLASIPKYKLNIHEPRINEVDEERTVKLSLEQFGALRSLLRDLDSAKTERTEVVEESPEIETIPA